ncbi:MAG: formyltetrahydrofolate deformylase [Candidatus Nitrosoabyssus spongiisocia]|nr:MAG: formyltetrahydrofolate deformylase [Nitrosopumilaceae archaeon AB1(1)]
MKKMTIGIVVVGKDKEGLVASFTNFIFQNNGNIESLNQNVINSLFGMHMETSFTKLDIKKFNTDLKSIAKKYNVDAYTHHEIGSKKNIAIFVTKESHCLSIILNSRKSLRGIIKVIVGTDPTLKSMANKAKIPFVLVEDKNQEKAESKLITICKKYNIDLIVLARYMRILSSNFVWRYPNRIINIHPSLLPAFSGAFAYAQAYERGAKIIGVTSHYVTENLNQGPIIAQESFKVDPKHSLTILKNKGQKLEAKTLLHAVKLHLNNKLDVRWRKVHLKIK